MALIAHAPQYKALPHAHPSLSPHVGQKYRPFRPSTGRKSDDAIDPEETRWGVVERRTVVGRKQSSAMDGAMAAGLFLLAQHREDQSDKCR